MPALSSTLTEGKIVSWVKSEGDKLSKGKSVVLVESDMADMDVEYLAAIIVDEGLSAALGSPIALLAETEEEIALAQSKKTSSSAPASAPAAEKNDAPKVLDEMPSPSAAATPAAKMDDPLHLEKFSHSWSVELGQSVAVSKNLRAQEFDYFLVLDLEGKVEILEFPVLLFDAKTMDVVDVFHRFVRPTKMSEKRINEYIEGKYGKFSVDRVWHDTAIKFEDVIEQFESWLRKERDGHNRLWREGEDLNKAAFVTCGNWDLKAKIPQQSEVSGMKLPLYFMEWINLKNVYLNFYNRRAPGMLNFSDEGTPDPAIGKSPSRSQQKEAVVLLIELDFSFKIALNSFFSLTYMIFAKALT